MSTNQIEQRADARSAMQRAMGRRSLRARHAAALQRPGRRLFFVAGGDGRHCGLPAPASDALGQALGEGGSAALSALSSLKGAAKDGLKDAADLLADPGLAQGLLQQPHLPLQPQAEPTDMTPGEGRCHGAGCQRPGALAQPGRADRPSGRQGRPRHAAGRGGRLAVRLGSAATTALRQEQGAVVHAAFLAPQSAAGDAAGTALATASANAAALLLRTPMQPGP